jgi:rhodanese-related sulfurtransferase
MMPNPAPGRSGPNPAPGRSGPNPAPGRSGLGHVPSISIAEIPDGSYILDVREDHEWVAGHAPHAQHLPMQHVPVRLAEIPTEGNVVVACRMGGRSAQVTAYLLAQGWDNVVNLDGGMLAWEAAGRPLVASDVDQTPQVV